MKAPNKSDNFSSGRLKSRLQAGLPAPRCIVLALAAMIAANACSREKTAPRTSINPMDATAAPVAGMAHGNHNPKYGGVVLMNGDLHFEVVAKAEGSYTVYFSDATRQELPASAVSDVRL